MGVTVAGETDLAPRGARPRVLAMPSPTVSRSLLLVAALLSAGLFVGTWIHNQSSAADDWLARVRECESQRPVVSPGAELTDVLSSEQAFLQCVQGAQERLAWFALGGVALTVVAGIAVLAAVPGIIRRRRGLKPASPRLAAAADHVATLAQDSGLRTAPATMVGSSKVRDAFSFGLPGRYSVVLPPALAVRNTDVAFEPLVRHELAHVARHDVLIAWSARAVWYAVAALLAVPLVWAIVEGDLSLLPSYAWRAALLLTAALLASAGILRSREYDADLSSATSEPRREALRTLLGTSLREPETGWRRLLALHPSGAERTAVLAEPARLARPSWLDAGLAAFLAALTVPLLVSVFATVPSITDWAYVVPAVLVGPLMGATVGLGLWRLAVVETVVQGRSTVPAAARRMAGGVLVGSLLGEAASLASVGATEILGTSSPLVLLIASVALAGTVFVTAGLGMLAADRAGRISARAYTVAALVLPGMLFALVLWATTTVTHAWDLGGWTLTGRVVLDLLTHPAAAVVVAALTGSVLVLLLLNRSPAPPAWAVEPEAVVPIPGVHAAWAPRLRTTLGVGLMAGTVAAGCLLAFRMVAGPAADDEELLQRVDTSVWVFAAAGAMAAVALLLLYGIRAGGAGLLACVVASTTTALGFLAISVANGGALTLGVLDRLVRPGVTLGALVLVVVSGIAVLPLPQAVSTRPVWLTAIVTALLAAGVAGGALAIRETLSPIVPGIAVNAMTTEQYVTVYSPAVEAQLRGIGQTVVMVNEEIAASPSRAASRIRTELLPVVGAMRAQAEPLDVADEALRQAQDLLVGGLRGTERSFETYARALESGDSDLFTQAQDQQAAALQQLQLWRDAVTKRAQTL